MRTIHHDRELQMYQNAIEWTMKVFSLTKAFPDEERYVLTDQVRRSSRSVCFDDADDPILGPAVRMADPSEKWLIRSHAGS